VFFGKNGGRAASGVAAEKKNLFFFLRSFPERMFREVNGTSDSCPRCAGSQSVIEICNNNVKIKINKTPSFRQAPECPLLFHHNGRVAGALKGLSVMLIKFLHFIKIGHIHTSNSYE
jgi:hypothetical protein